MDAEVTDGGGQNAPDRTMYKWPESSQMTSGWYCLQNRQYEDLESYPIAVLWHLCLELDIRRANARDSKSLAHELVSWVSQVSI